MAACSASGISPAEWCRKQELSYSMVSAWFKKEPTLANKPGGFVTLSVDAGRSPAKNVEILYPGGVRLILPADTDPAYILALIRIWSAVVHISDII